MEGNIYSVIIQASKFKGFEDPAQCLALAQLIETTVTPYRNIQVSGQRLLEVMQPAPQQVKMEPVVLHVGDGLDQFKATHRQLNGPALKILEGANTEAILKKIKQCLDQRQLDGMQRWTKLLFDLLLVTDPKNARKLAQDAGI